MVRAPYPARIAAGLIVTAIEETRKLPALIITLPMTAVSQTLQAGMRAQQGIAELAIKGDAVLELLFDKPSEQPTWATFDEDEIEGPPDDLPIETRPRLVETPAADTPATETPATDDPVVETPVGTPAAEDSDASADDAPRADVGRFALYSSAPTEIVEATSTPAAETPAADAPEIVEYLDYDTLTLAQLRAKIRTVSGDDLADLAAYEKSSRNRAPFVTMLDNRIAAQAKRHTTT